MNVIEKYYIKMLFMVLYLSVSAHLITHAADDMAVSFRQPTVGRGGK